VGDAPCEMCWIPRGDRAMALDHQWRASWAGVAGVARTERAPPGKSVLQQQLGACLSQMSSVVKFCAVARC
jgi:hypothetical protein